jgi:hypothetical protein
MRCNVSMSLDFEDFMLIKKNRCAMGAAYEPKYHPDLVTFPRSLSQFFGDRAKALLELEIENPSLATIQALVICSNYEASGTRDTRGWLYSGKSSLYLFGYWKQIHLKKGWPCDLHLTKVSIWMSPLTWKRVSSRQRNVRFDEQFSGARVSTTSMTSLLAVIKPCRLTDTSKILGLLFGTVCPKPGSWRLRSKTMLE